VICNANKTIKSPCQWPFESCVDPPTSKFGHFGAMCLCCENMCPLRKDAVSHGKSIKSNPFPANWNISNPFISIKTQNVSIQRGCEYFLTLNPKSRKGGQPFVPIIKSKHVHHLQSVGQFRGLSVIRMYSIRYYMYLAWWPPPLLFFPPIPLRLTCLYAVGQRLSIQICLLLLAHCLPCLQSSRQ